MYSNLFLIFQPKSNRHGDPLGCVGGGRVGGGGGGGVMAMGREAVGSLPPSELDLCEMCHLI